MVVSKQKTSVIRREQIGIILMLASVIGTFLALTQTYSGYGLREKVSIGPAVRISPDQKTFRWKALRTTELSAVQERHAVVLENGQPTGRRAVRLYITQTRGGGWYFVKDSIVRFAPVDGSDPRTNGRTYELEYPAEVRGKVWWTLAAVFLAGWFIAAGNRGLFINWEQHVPRLQRALPWVLLTAFVVIKLATLRANPHYDDGVFSLNGLPASDASGWHDNGEDLARGLGYHEDRRPGYLYLLGGMYQWFGGNVRTALITNALLHAVAATAVFLMGARLGSRLLGLTVALHLLFADETMKLALVVLTENAGLAYGTLALLCFHVALKQRSERSAFVSGLLIGVGNLAAGMYLLTVPFYPLLLSFVAWRERWGWRRWVRMAGVFTLAVCLIFVPWLIRQKMVCGIAIFAPNTAELLYGGAHPTEGKMTRELYHQAELDDYKKDGTKGGYSYFMAKYRALVAEDPIRYGKQLWNAFVTALDSVPRAETAWGWLTACGLFAMMVAEIYHRRSLLPLVPGGIILVLSPHVELLPMSYVLPVAAVIGMVSCARPLRQGWLSVFTTFGAVLILCAVIGNIITKRFFAASSWLPFFVWIGAWRAVLYHGTEFLSCVWSKLFKTNPTSKLSDTCPALAVSTGDRFAISAGWTVLGIFLIAFLTTSAASAWHHSHPGTSVRLSDDQINQLQREITANHPDEKLRTLPPEKIEIAVVVLDDRQAFIDANEDTNSMTRTGEKRSYARWIGEASHLDHYIPYHGVLVYQAAGPLPKVPAGEAVVIAGIRNPAELNVFGNNFDLFEVIAFYSAEIDGSNARPLNPIWFEVTEHFLNALAKSNETP